ncbi:MAG: heme ABC exporter ATP-binding protein CcmA [Candidatus Limnocylindria bacterium]
MPQTTIYVSPRSVGAPDTRPPAVRTAGLARLFAGSPALADVSLQTDAGRVIALLGPNGAGKTTLLRMLATAIRPSFGSAQVDGLDVVRDAAAVRERVAYLSHASGLYDDLTAVENLAFATTMLNTPDPVERVARALDDVGLAGVASQRVRGFSAGMRRRLALGRILLGQPSVVLLDEPYAALDQGGMELVDALLDAWRAAGVSVMAASHAAERLAARADGSVHLDGGRVARVEGVGALGLASPSRTAATPVPAGAAR